MSRVPIARTSVLHHPFDPRRLPPGRYIASSHTPAYAQLHALAILGRAQEMTLARVPGGGKIGRFTVGVGARKRNDGQGGGGRISVGARFFKGALKDYEDWKLKWWREAIQNAVDAGARNVECGVVEQADGTFRVWCQDDGKGMTRDVLLTKFLVLGESGKDLDAGATGGFGKAKEMLLLPWVSWSIVSRDTRVDGVGIDYTVTPQYPPLDGTRIEVVMPADDHTTELRAAEFISRCHLPRVRFVLVRSDSTSGGEQRREVAADLRAGKHVADFEEKARLHYDKTSSRNEIYIRVNGIYMFDRYAPDGFKGLLVVELVGKSTELLAANRDSIRDYDLRRAYEQLTNRLATDTKSALEKKSGKIRKVYKGSGRFAAKPPKQAEADLAVATAGALAPSRAAPVAGGGVMLDATTVQEVMDVLAGVGAAVVEDGDIVLGGASSAVAAATLAGVAMQGQEHLERTVKQLAWAPDFYVVNEIEDWRVPAKYLPEKMSKAVLAVAKVWTELVRLVLIRLNSDVEYGIGWVFSDEARAMFSRAEGQHWILLNPRVHPETLDIGGDSVYDPSNVRHLARMWASAIHEATHWADRCDYHNEAFTSAFTANVATCADAWPTAIRIAQAVLGGANVQLREALKVAEGHPHGRRGKAPPPRIVEKIVEKFVDRPVYVDRPVEVERLQYVDRPVYIERPVPTPAPHWSATPRPGHGAPRQLELAPSRRRPMTQPSLTGLKLNGRPRKRNDAPGRLVSREVPGFRVSVEDSPKWPGRKYLQFSYDHTDDHGRLLPQPERLARQRVQIGTLYGVRAALDPRNVHNLAVDATPGPWTLYVEPEVARHYTDATLLALAVDILRGTLGPAPKTNRRARAFAGR